MTRERTDERNNGFLGAAAEAAEAERRTGRAGFALDAEICNSDR